MVLAGHVQNGAIVLNDPVPLPEGTAVEVQIIARPPIGTAARSLFEVLEPFVGQATDLPTDAAKNIDHYLYGHPKS
jgi:hypothetical protein